MNKNLLSVNKINKYFNKSGKLFQAVRNASFDVHQGDFFGIIGESGSGKSTIGKMIIRLLETNSGYILFDDNLISNKKIDKKIHAWLCQNMQMVFQDPMGSLNPRKNILNIISEPLRIHKIVKKEAQEIIDNAIMINPYFQYTYKEKDYILSKEFDDYYFTNMIQIYSEGIQKIKSFEINPNFTSEENYFEFISYLLKLDERAKKVNYSLYDYSSKVKQVLFDCLELHKKKMNNPIEIALFEVKENLKKQKQLIKKPLEYYNLNEKLKKIKKLLDEHLIKSTERFTFQLKQFLLGTIHGYKSEVKININKFRASSNIVDCLNYQLKILKDRMLIENIKTFITYDSLDIIDAREYLNVINDHLNNNFFDIKNRIDSFSQNIKDANSINNPELNKEYVQLIDDIKKEYSNPNNKIDHSKFDFSIYNSFEIRKVDKQKTKEFKNEISSIKLRLKEIASQNYKSSVEYNDNLQKYEQLKKDKENILVECEKDYETSISKFNEIYGAKIEEHNIKLKGYYRDFNALKKEYSSVVKSKAKQIINKMKTIFPNSKEDAITFKNEVYNKLKTIDALSFEFDNILEEVIVYRNLRHINPFKVRLQKPALIKIITRTKVYQALNEVGLKNEHAYRYPHEFSGGQRQRIVIARSLISNPKLIIADEAISALDVSIQAQVINIMKDLCDKKGITFLFIAHDLSMVNYSCNRMIIMHNGRILEKGDTKEIFNNPIHPYTISLLKAAPELSKIHVDLANFNLDGSGYNPNNVDDEHSKFIKIPNQNEHYVYGTEEQVEEWIKMTHYLD